MDHNYRDSRCVQTCLECGFDFLQVTEDDDTDEILDCPVCGYWRRPCPQEGQLDAVYLEEARAEYLECSDDQEAFDEACKLFDKRQSRQSRNIFAEAEEG